MVETVRVVVVRGGGDGGPGRSGSPGLASI